MARASPCPESRHVEVGRCLNSTTFVQFMVTWSDVPYFVDSSTMKLNRAPFCAPFMRLHVRPTFHANRAFYTTRTEIRRIQTPVQSIPKEKVAPSPLEPPGSSGPVQTPVQSQTPSQVAPGAPADQGSLPQPSAQITQVKPMLYLTFGLTGVAVFSYFYYQYRKEHMDRKWAAMQEEARQNVKNR